MPECEVCGEYSENVKEYMGKMLCEQCYVEAEYDCPDYPDECDGQDLECKRKVCPWFQYSENHP